MSLVALLLVGCASTDAGTDGDEPEANGRRAGEVEFVQYCASCHGLSGKGDGPAAPSLERPAADLTKLRARYGDPLPRPQLIRLIDGTEPRDGHGDREMPVWGKELFDEGSGPERAARVRGTILVIIDYLESIQETS
jgi:mono/diheme cytochrome c family protein